MGRVLSWVRRTEVSIVEVTGIKVTHKVEHEV